MKQNKDVRMTIRFTPEQYESICGKAQSAFLSPSAYVRAAALRHKVTVVPGLDAVARELKGIGRNLNQLTTLAHMKKIEAVHLEDSCRQLEHIYTQLYLLHQQESR